MLISHYQDKKEFSYMSSKLLMLNFAIMHNFMPGLSIRELHDLSGNHVSSKAALVHNCLLQRLELIPKWQHRYECRNFRHWRNNRRIQCLNMLKWSQKGIYEKVKSMKVKKLSKAPWVTLSIFSRFLCLSLACLYYSCCIANLSFGV